MASKIFARVGVPIRWCDGQPPKDSKPGVTLRIRLKAEVARVFWPDALAMTMPEKGHPAIDVFCSRVVAAPHASYLLPAVLGYVLVHEMAHVLQSEGRHSRGGNSVPDHAR